jgi:hypothetical protein
MVIIVNILLNSGMYSDHSEYFIEQSMYVTIVNILLNSGVCSDHSEYFIEQSYV